MTHRCTSQHRDSQTLTELTRKCDLRQLGLDPHNITQVDHIHDKHGSRVYRISCGNTSFVLKCFPDPAQADEVRCYALLQHHGVPTLPVHGQADNAILLEDLAVSPSWRPAAEPDVESPKVGRALAQWYRTLHAAGREILAAPDGPPPFLGREIDALDPAVVLDIGQKLGLAANPVWRLAADSVGRLVHAMRSLPETLNYNDFHWTNLALSRHRTQPLRAIVYDYHLLGIGVPYSDWRNVIGSLGKRAKAAFIEAYGPVDEREALLDAPLSILFGLAVAVQRPHLPEWAKDLLPAVQSGRLEADFRRALDTL